MHAHVLVDKCNWALLRIFRVIVQAGSLNKAAIQLCVTQSALSQSLKRLEQQVGSCLILRQKGQFQLTAVGEIVFEASLMIYNQLNEIEQRLKQQQNTLSGTIRLLVLSRVQSARFDRVLHDFHQKYPLVDFQVDVHKSPDIQQLLLQKVPALGLALSPKHSAKMHYQLLIRQHYALFCGQGHALYRQDIEHLEQICNHGFISFHQDQLDDINSHLHDIRDKILQQNKLLVTTNNLDEVMRFIKNGFGFGLLPKHIVAASPQPHAFKQLPPFPDVGIAPIYLQWHKERELSLIEQYFVQELRVTFASH